MGRGGGNDCSDSREAVTRFVGHCILVALSLAFDVFGSLGFAFGFAFRFAFRFAFCFAGSTDALAPSCLPWSGARDDALADTASFAASPAARSPSDGRRVGPSASHFALLSGCATPRLCQRRAASEVDKDVASVGALVASVCRSSADHCIGRGTRQHESPLKADDVVRKWRGSWSCQVGRNAVLK